MSDDNVVKVDLGLFSVRTETCLDDKTILQQITLMDPITRAVRDVSTRLSRTTDEQFRSALIKLGWTPPKE